MKTLAELRDRMTDLPMPFAADGDTLDLIHSSDDMDSPTENFVSHGFSSESPMRYRMNSLGLLATERLFFKRRGGRTTFSSSYSQKIGGYPKGAVLVHDDGKFVSEAVSEVIGNTSDPDAAGTGMGCLSMLVDDAVDAKKRVLWRNATHVYGDAEGLMRIGVDYSRRHDLAYGDRLEEDSLIVVPLDFDYNKDLILIRLTQVGVFIYEGDVEEVADSANTSSSSDTPIAGVTVDTWTGVELSDPAIYLQNKGIAGARFDMTETVPAFPNPLCGSASYCISLFCRKGTAVYCRLRTEFEGGNISNFPNQTIGQTPNMSAMAFPVIKNVRAATADDQ